MRWQREGGAHANGCPSHQHSGALADAKPPDKSDVIATMRRYGVPVHVNEFDVNMKDVPGTQEERFAKQAEIYRDMLQAALESGVCTNFMLFGFGDRYSWLELDKTQAAFSPNADPTPFDDNLKPNPAYYAMLDVLANYKPS